MMEERADSATLSRSSTSTPPKSPLSPRSDPGQVCPNSRRSIKIWTSCLWLCVYIFLLNNAALRYNACFVCEVKEQNNSSGAVSCTKLL